MRVLSIKVFSILSICSLFLMGSQCSQDPIAILERIEVARPPEVKSLIPDPIEREFNEDGTYCTKQPQTGSEFLLFGSDSVPVPITDFVQWESLREEYNIHISAEGMLSILNFFKTEICSESLIECRDFVPTLSSEDRFENEVNKVSYQIESALQLKNGDGLETLIVKTALLRIWDKFLVEFRDLALEANRKRGTKNEAVSL